MKLPIVILTVPRQENYIEGTVHSLRASGYFASGSPSARIVTGSPETGHLKNISADGERLTICGMPRDVAAAAGYEQLTTKQRCSFGHYRWMTLLSGEDLPSEWVMACEDDIAFSRGWEGFLSCVLSEVRDAGKGPAIVTLYRMFIAGHTNDRAAERYERGERWYEFTDHFWGTQAVVYPKCILKDLATYLFEKGVRTFTNPVDVLIGQFARTRGIPTIATTPSMVNHVGIATTGQSNLFHQADFYLESVQGWC